jgi:hypothetical protein
MDRLWQDVKYAARSLRRTPGFTTAAIATLALGIGANATIFTLLDAVLFKPLPVSRPSELFTLYENTPDAAPDAVPDTAGGTGQYLKFSHPRFRRLQQTLGEDGSLAARESFPPCSRWTAECGSSPRECRSPAPWRSASGPPFAPSEAGVSTVSTSTGESALTRR